MGNGGNKNGTRVKQKSMGGLSTVAISKCRRDLESRIFYVGLYRLLRTIAYRSHIRELAQKPHAAFGCANSPHAAFFFHSGSQTVLFDTPNDAPGHKK
jgi:hypothetical protein